MNFPTSQSSQGSSHYSNASSLSSASSLVAASALLSALSSAQISSTTTTGNSNEMKTNRVIIDDGNKTTLGLITNSFEIMNRARANINSQDSQHGYEIIHGYSALPSSNSTTTNSFRMSNLSSMNNSSSSSYPSYERLDANEKQRAQTILIAPKHVANALSEYEQRQRQGLYSHQQQQFHTLPQWKEQKIIKSIQMRQQDLDMRRERLRVKSIVVHDLLEENNKLISSYLEQSRQSTLDYSSKHAPSSTTFKGLLDRVKRNLHTISHQLGTESNDSPFTGSESSGSNGNSNSNSKHSDSHSVFHNYETANKIPSLLTIAKSPIQTHEYRAGALNTSADSMGSVLNVSPSFDDHLSPNFSSKQRGFMPSLLMPSSANSSTHESPVTSPSWNRHDMDTEPAHLRIGSSDNHMMVRPVFESYQTPLFFSNLSKDEGMLSHTLGAKKSADSLSSLLHSKQSSTSPSKLDRNGSREPPKLSLDIAYKDNETLKSTIAVEKRKRYNNSSTDSGDDDTDPEFMVIERPEKRKYRRKEKNNNAAENGASNTLTVEQVLSELEGLPEDFIENSYHFTTNEIKHWQGIKSHIIRARSNSDQLPDNEKWRAWVQMTAELPLNNGGPIKRLIEVAKYYAEIGGSNPEVIKALQKALGPSVYKVNAAGGCRKMALELLQLY